LSATARQLLLLPASYLALLARYFRVAASDAAKQLLRGEFAVQGRNT